MSSNQEPHGRCPIKDCNRDLVYHETYGVPAPSNPLIVQITRHVYQCPDHGVFAYLGDGTFRRIDA